MLCHFKGVFIRFSLSIMILALLTIPYPALSEDERDNLKVERDKEKTVYTIGSSQKDKKDQSEEDRKNSWDMLKNSNLWIRK
ncbi:MAG TPA: hypothetical protein PLA81_10380 [Syntrophorhabdaceae bacterium]|nr:hypothetical protein [Syntrophorhabdaceae bacterium]HPL41975.1 hypothetical protein [Syntrophorhabdaceae bacterium]